MVRLTVQLRDHDNSRNFRIHQDVEVRNVERVANSLAKQLIDGFKKNPKPKAQAE